MGEVLEKTEVEEKEAVRNKKVGGKVWRSVGGRRKEFWRKRTVGGRREEFCSEKEVLEEEALEE